MLCLFCMVGSINTRAAIPLFLQGLQWLDDRLFHSLVRFILRLLFDLNTNRSRVAGCTESGIASQWYIVFSKGNEQ